MLRRRLEMLRWRLEMLRRRLPTHVGHVGTPTDAARRTLVMFDARFESGRGAIPGGMRGRSHSSGVAVSARSGRRATNAEVCWQRSSLL